MIPPGFEGYPRIRDRHGEEWPDIVIVSPVGIFRLRDELDMLPTSDEGRGLLQTIKPQVGASAFSPAENAKAAARYLRVRYTSDHAEWWRGHYVTPLSYGRRGV